VAVPKHTRLGPPIASVLVLGLQDACRSTRPSLSVRCCVAHHSGVSLPPRSRPRAEEAFFGCYSWPEARRSQAREPPLNQKGGRLELSAAVDSVVRAACVPCGPDAGCGCVGDRWQLACTRGGTLLAGSMGRALLAAATRLCSAQHAAVLQHAAMQYAAAC